MSIIATDRISPYDGIGTANTQGGDAHEIMRQAGIGFDVELVPCFNSAKVKDRLTDIRDMLSDPDQPNNIVRVRRLVDEALGSVIMGPPARYNPKKEDREEPVFYQVTRSDTSAPLGIVMKRYRPIQNSACAEIADAMRESGAKITRASSLDNGARCFWNLEWPRNKDINVVGDIVGRRGIIQNSHDGRYSALVRLVPLRLQCLNGMVVPVPKFGFEFRIKHTESSVERVEQAKVIMAGSGRYFDTFAQVGDRMARTPVTDAHATAILKHIPSLKKDTDGAREKLAAIMALFKGEQRGASNEAMRGTAWGLLNAATEFADYAQGNRITGGSDRATQRFKSAFEGTSKQLKDGAYEAIINSPSGRELGLSDLYAKKGNLN